MASYHSHSSSFFSQRNAPFIAFAVILFLFSIYKFSPSSIVSITPLSCTSYPRPYPAPSIINPPVGRSPIRVLLTGGAGYIGSHMSIELLQGDVCYDIISVDDLSRGDMRNVKNVEKFVEQSKASGGSGSFCHSYKFIKTDIDNYDLMVSTFKSHQTELVIHFAGYAYASESVAEPLKYYENTPFRTEKLLKAMKEAGVKRLVYSSSSAVYGSVETPGCSLAEGGPLKPTSPYGQSKLMSEQIIKAFAYAEHKAGNEFSFALLRYFNVIGADEQGRVGPLPKQEFAHYGRIMDSAFNSLIQIKSFKKQGKVISDKEKDNMSLKIYGNDYTETEDGTAMRDYIHVSDLVDAHRLISYGVHDDNQLIYNIGYGKGYTVKQVVDTIQKVTGEEIFVSYKEKRAGDPAVVLGDPSLLLGDFHWKPRYNNLEKAIETHWNWRKKVESGQVN